jgi:hypothetical protein
MVLACWKLQAPAAGDTAMTATFAILLIAALLMAGVIADSLWGRRLRR